jgi:hypothetical protein
VPIEIKTPPPAQKGGKVCKKIRHENKARTTPLLSCPKRVDPPDRAASPPIAGWRNDSNFLKRLSNRRKVNDDPIPAKLARGPALIIAALKISAIL